MRNSSRNDIIIFAFCVTVAGLVFYNADGDSMIQVVLRTLLFLAFLTFFMYIGSKVLDKIKKWKSSRNEATENSHDSLRERRFYSRKQALIDRIQDGHTEKATSYKEKILVPRKEAEAKKKEKELDRSLLGPAWKGKGFRLGGNENNKNLESTGTSDDAAQHRKLPGQVTQPVFQEEQMLEKRREVIVLPDEPVEGATDNITVVLRTPQGVSCHRRFLQSHTLQTVLDYMTTLGYSKTVYTLATVYPRQLLSDCTQQSLGVLGFKGKVILNIEEYESLSYDT